MKKKLFQPQNGGDQNLNVTSNSKMDDENQGNKPSHKGRVKTTTTFRVNFHATLQHESPTVKRRRFHKICVSAQTSNIGAQLIMISQPQKGGVRT